nr:hypothetical protein BaRGS_009186 [Batillaria attramentaria]
MAGYTGDWDPDERDTEGWLEEAICPKLIDFIQKILSQYPDDGQIFKEMIQNAEDAGANTVTILADTRHFHQSFNPVTLERFPHLKYFKGPALCIYNNQEFTSGDWRSIRMLHQSVKEKNPMKVGRFGLGFKSVFHLTEVPLDVAKTIVNVCKKNSVNLVELPAHVEKDLDLQGFLAHVSCGSHQSQDEAMLRDVIVEIQRKHERLNVTPEKCSDLKLVKEILTRLKEEDSACDGTVLIPVQIPENPLALRFKPAKDCTIVSGGMEAASSRSAAIYIVNPQITPDTARALGALDMRARAMEGLEAIDFGYGQREDLIDRLKDLLEHSYRDGLSVPKELIQNADDAGARKVFFLLDERENPDARSNLFYPQMASQQGPAVWAYNDAKFSDKDIANITRLGAQTKEDASKTQQDIKIYEELDVNVKMTNIAEDLCEVKACDSTTHWRVAWATGTGESAGIARSQWLSSNDSMKFLNGKIPPETARILGVKTKKREDFVRMAKALPWAQKEELTTRIKRLLQGYTFDSSILQELIQNAEDARATEIHFIKDFRNLSTERVVEGCSFLQGPALCVYNNSFFTEEDLKGIISLGEGSKGLEPLKVGQYGVGFNAVYHLTDIPSFWTRRSDGKEVMVVLDPNCQHLPVEGGVRLEEIDQNSYSDTFQGFLRDCQPEYMSKPGTLFRFPLRTEEMAKTSQIKDLPVADPENSPAWNDSSVGILDTVMMDVYNYLDSMSDLTELIKLPLVCDTENKRLFHAENVVIYASEDEVFAECIQKLPVKFGGFASLFKRLGEEGTVDAEDLPPNIDEVLRQIRQTLTEAWRQPCLTKRRRVVMRLYMQWNPARNFDKEFCTKAVEKALKAVILDKNAVEDSLSHDLTGLAEFVHDPDLISVARQLEVCVGRHTHMRYPHCRRQGKIPADVYVTDEARDACGYAEQALQRARRLLM